MTDRPPRDRLAYAVLGTLGGLLVAVTVFTLDRIAAGFDQARARDVELERRIYALELSLARASPHDAACNHESRQAC